MRRFVSGALAAISVGFGIITSHFRIGRHFCTAGVFREMMKRRFTVWKQVIGLKKQLRKADRRGVVRSLCLSYWFFVLHEDKLTISVS